MTTTKMLTQVSDDNATAMKLGSWIFWLALFIASLTVSSQARAADCSADNTITANVVVIDNPTVFNRLGAQNPNWMMYALERDVVHWDDGNVNESNNGVPCSVAECTAGKVQLRPDKRPRPLVVRAVEGGCLTVNFTNLLDPLGAPGQAPSGPQQLNPDLPNGGLFNDDFVADLRR